MEPIKKAKARTDGRILYRKIGGGSLRIHRKIIKPNEKFYAFPADVANFKNVVQPLEDIPKADAVEEKEIEGTIPKYRAVPRGKSKLWFDVVGPGEKVLNDKALKKDAAEKLIEDLAK